MEDEDMSWLWDGFVFLFKTFMVLNFITVVAIVIYEMRRRLFPEDDMRQHVFHVEGVETGTLWSMSTESNSRSESEREALREFRQRFQEEGVVVRSFTIEDGHET